MRYDTGRRPRTRAGLLAGACAAALLWPARSSAAELALQKPDSAASDTARYVLPPLTVNAARERAAPPPVSVLVVPPRELQRAQAANSFDLVRRAAGIEVHEQGQGPGFASDVVIRGFTSDHSADVLVGSPGTELEFAL